MELNSVVAILSERVLSKTWYAKGGQSVSAMKKEWKMEPVFYFKPKELVFQSSMLYGTDSGAILKENGSLE